MSAAETRARLLEETRQAFGRYTDVQARIENERGRGPEPGDVFAPDSPGDFVVSWVVLARDPKDAGRLLAVPADANSLVGSGDIAVAASASSGALTLRCRFTSSVAVGKLGPETRCGLLGADEAARARQRWSEIEDGTFTGSVLAREVDEDPEYQDWVRTVVVPARDRLSELADETKDSAGGTVVPFAGRRFLSGASRSRLIPLIAASILAGFVGGVVFRQDVFRQDQVEARRELSVYNHVLMDLRPFEAVRGRSEELRLPRRASHVMLHLSLGAAAPLPRYRLELLREATGKTIWEDDEFFWEEPGEVRGGIPASRLTSGEYRLRLSGLVEGHFRRIREHTLRIEKE